MSGKYLEENKWWVSPYNFVDEVRAGFELPERIEIHDATLRDGEQSPGASLTSAEKLEIAEQLGRLGVDPVPQRLQPER